MELMDIFSLKKSHIIEYEGKNDALKKELEINEEGMIKTSILIKEKDLFEKIPKKFNALAFMLLEGNKVIIIKSRTAINIAIFLFPKENKKILKEIKENKKIIFIPEENKVVTNWKEYKNKIPSEENFEDFIIFDY